MNKIRFGTDGWRAIIGKDYTFANLSRVTAAVAIYVQQQQQGLNAAVALGYDFRFNGLLFAKAVANQLAGSGLRVFLSTGPVSTPMVSLATLQKQCALGIILTASHNPPEYNGFKIKGSFGGPAWPAQIAAIEALIPDQAIEVPDNFENYVDTRQIEYYDMEALYLNHIKQSFDWSLIRSSGIKIGYDAMYGAGQGVMRKLFPGAELLHCDNNPGFKGQAPEPIERKLADFQVLIRDKGIEFGLATDGDADRIGLFDEKGNFVDSHHILLLLIYYLHELQGMSGGVVTTFSCTDKIAALCTRYRLKHQITKIGFKYIGEIMAKEPVLVGGEESGGIAVINHVPERDGIYIGLLLLELMAKTKKSLTELISAIYERVGTFSVQRYDLHLSDTEKQSVISRCQAGGWKTFANQNVVKIETLDGFKFRLDSNNWIMFRASGTEPVLRIYAEAANREAALELLDAGVEQIKKG